MTQATNNLRSGMPVLPTAVYRAGDSSGNKLGALPLPNISAFTRVFDALWGEGWGEGVTGLSIDRNPSPHTSPKGRGSRAALVAAPITPDRSLLERSAPWPQTSTARSC